jgi:hypothetical protein
MALPDPNHPTLDDHAEEYGFAETLAHMRYQIESVRQLLQDNRRIHSDAVATMARVDRVLAREISDERHPPECGPEATSSARRPR